MSTVHGILAPLGVVILLTAIILLAYFYARRRRHSDRQVQLTGASVESDHDTSDGDVDGEGGHGEFGLDEATIMSFPNLPYQEAAEAMATGIEAGNGSNSSSSSTSCSICLVDYKEPDMVRAMPVCNHFFHIKCVDPWLKLHSTCPICRKQIIGRLI